MRRSGLLIAVLAILAALVASPAGAQKGLQGKIDAKRRAIDSSKGRERVLSGDIASLSRQISGLQADITRLQARQVRLQASLDAKLAELARVQARLRAERLRLARLKARLAEARRALADRLVQLYKADNPDVVTVVLESDGFADLLERTDFMERVSDQDRRIIGVVQRAKAEATRTASRLAALEARAKAVAAAIQVQRDQVAAVRGQLVERRAAYASARSRKTAALASTRAHRHDLEGDLGVLVAEQRRIQARLQAAAARAARSGSGGGGGGGGAPVAGPVRPGASGLVWPVNGPIVSPFEMRWGRLHAGVDIAAPTGTPIRAAAAGTVALMGWVGGYGNYTCIQHGGALSTCYGHQSRFGTSQGAHVAQGQVIGYVGCTGHCFGPHVHFETRINGAPVNPAAYL